MMAHYPSALRRPPGEGGSSGGRARPPSDRIHLPEGAEGDTEGLLTDEALGFLAGLARKFGPRRERLLADRRAGVELGAAWHAGPPAESGAIRGSEWSVPPPAPGLEYRRVEIVGEPTARTIVRGLNSKADSFVADFDDLFAPTWEGTLRGHGLLARAVRRTLDYSLPNGERFRIVRQPATLVLRPRGLHVVESHLEVDGVAVPAALFDVGLFAFHNARELVRDGTGPYFYLPKVERYLEAQWWADVLGSVGSDLGFPTGTLRATAMIETLPASGEMDEILFALRPHSAGLALGRSGLFFSQLKALAARPTVHEPDPEELASADAYVAGCAARLIDVCHRRGAAAINATPVHLLNLEDGGPSRPELGQELADKIRDVREGFDGTWVVHPGAVPAVREFFTTRQAPGLRSRSRAPGDGRRLGGVPGSLAIPPAPRQALRIALRYLEARFRGIGTVVVDGRVEDAASAEIARTWLWWWVHGAEDDRARPERRPAQARTWLEEERATLVNESGADGRRAAAVEHAAGLVDLLATAPGLVPYLPSPGEPRDPEGTEPGLDPTWRGGPPDSVARNAPDSVPM